MNGEFTLSHLQSKCHGVSRDMVRKVLKDLQKLEKVVSKGRGVAARWRRKDLPLKCLSSVRGNSHAEFLEGNGL